MRVRMELFAGIRRDARIDGLSIPSLRRVEGVPGASATRRFP
jgi:hypothetical protein